MTTLLQDQPIVGQAYRKYQQFNQDERLRAIDEAHQRYLHDLATDIEEAEERGESKKAFEIARNMIIDGFGIDIISRITGLSHSEIERLN